MSSQVGLDRYAIGSQATLNRYAMGGQRGIRIVKSPKPTLFMGSQVGLTRLAMSSQGGIVGSQPKEDYL